MKCKQEERSYDSVSRLHLVHFTLGVSKKNKPNKFVFPSVVPAQMTLRLRSTWRYELESLSGREWQTVHVTRSPLIGWGDQSSIEPITDPRKG